MLDILEQTVHKFNVTLITVKLAVYLLMFVPIVIMATPILHVEQSSAMYKTVKQDVHLTTLVLIVTLATQVSTVELFNVM
jgi:hypothetical protein